MVLERISREQMLMEVAHVVARRGTCSRAQVGVVFAREGRILATGYNGAPRGIPHCVHQSAYVTNRNAPQWLLELYETFRNSPDHLVVGHITNGTSYHWDGQKLTVGTGPTQAPGCSIVEHAERNAIAFSARHGIALGDSDVFCTHAPCLDCARALLGTGIRSLVYEIPYRLTAGVELLQQQGISVIDWSVDH